MKKRVISAAVLLTVALTCVFLSEYTRVLFFAAAGICCAYEYSRALEKINVFCAAWVMYTYILVQSILVVLHTGTVSYIACMAMGVYLALFSGVIHPKVKGSGAIYTVAGLAYPGIIFGLMLMICVSDNWKDVLILGCFSCWMCDCFALLGGMRFGKHKIAPDISPKKTVEGCVCGAVAGTVTGLIIYLVPFMCPDVSLATAMITCFVASSLGQVGDLAESLIKRMLEIKDFSDLIPGHGGMFDRTDSLMFSIPAAYICLYIAGMIH